MKIENFNFPKFQFWTLNLKYYEFALRERAFNISAHGARPPCVPYALFVRVLRGPADEWRRIVRLSFLPPFLQNWRPENEINLILLLIVVPIYYRRHIHLMNIYAYKVHAEGAAVRSRRAQCPPMWCRCVYVCLLLCSSSYIIYMNYYTCTMYVLLLLLLQRVHRTKTWTRDPL